MQTGDGIGQGRTLDTPGKVRSSSRVLFTNQAFFYSRLEIEPECQPVADKYHVFINTLFSFFFRLAR